MPKNNSKRWSDDDLAAAVLNSRSYREVLLTLGLVPAGGNYTHVRSRIEILKISTEHFLGKGWNIGLQFRPKIPPLIDDILVIDSTVQSYKLKNRLFKEGYKTPKCELCGWCETSLDGRVPVELDHINGVHSDNRLENLRILCPNCHSLQSTHRGKNINNKSRASAGMVDSADLKSVE